jgi:hypothetical protein
LWTNGGGGVSTKGFFILYEGALGIFEGLAEGFEGLLETLLLVIVCH